MKIFYLFTFIVLFVKCSDREHINPDAINCNNLAVEIMKRAIVEPDSFKFAIKLIDNAINLAPEVGRYRDTKAQFYLQYGDKELARETLLLNWGISQKNYSTALVLGAIYEEDNQIDSALIYYNEAYNCIITNYDNANIAIRINKVVIEKMLNKDIDFALLEDEIARKEDTDFAKELLNKIKTKSRSELIDMLLQNR